MNAYNVLISSALLVFVWVQTVFAAGNPAYIQGLYVSGKGDVQKTASGQSFVSGELPSEVDLEPHFSFVSEDGVSLTQTGVRYEWQKKNDGLWQTLGSGKILTGGTASPGDLLRLKTTPRYNTGNGVVEGDTVVSQLYRLQSTQGFGWSEQIGFLDFVNTYRGAYIYQDKLEGYLWSENAGYVSLSGSGYGVELAKEGNGIGVFSGSAYSEKVGFIYFDDWATYTGVSASDFSDNKSFTFVDSSGNIEGYGYSDMIGYVSFDHNQIGSVAATTTFRPNHPPVLSQGNIVVNSSHEGMYHDSKISVDLQNLVSDLDGDTVDYHYSWKTSANVNLSTHKKSSLDLSSYPEIKKYRSLSVSVWADDGTHKSPVITKTFAIENRKPNPKQSDFPLTPSAPSTKTDISIQTPRDFVDGDGDELVIQTPLTWKKEDEDGNSSTMTGETGITLTASGNLVLFDNVWAKFKVCEVWGNQECSDTVQTAPVEVGNTNAPPYIEDLRYDKESYTTSDDITLLYDFFDVNPGQYDDANRRHVEFYRTRDAATLTISGSSPVLDSSHTQKGDEIWAEISVTDTGSDLSFASGSTNKPIYSPSYQTQKIQIQNEAPKITSGSVSVYSGGKVVSTQGSETLSGIYTDQSMALSVSGSLTDADDDAISYVYYDIYKNGELLRSASLSGYVASGEYIREDEIRYDVRVSDGHKETKQSFGPYSVHNSAPKMERCVYDKTALQTQKKLSVVVDARDIDNDTLSYNTTWYDNGQKISGTQSGARSIDFDTYNIDKGHTVSARVLASDGGKQSQAIDCVQNGISQTGVVRTNIAPSVRNAQVSPSIPDPDESVSALYDYYDVDGDPKNSVDITWYVSGSVVGIGKTLDLQNKYATGSSVHYDIVVNDGQTGSSKTRSHKAYISQDKPSPRAINANISYENTGHGEHELRANYSYLDPNTTEINDSHITWYVNGVVAKSGSNVSLLTGADVSQNDTVFVKIEPYNGQDYGEVTYSDKITVPNTVPKIEKVSFLSQNIETNDAIVAVPEAWSDEQNINETYNYRWYINNAYISEVSSRVLPSSYTRRGDTVKVQAIPYDGIAHGNPVMSQTITVANSVPQISDLYLPSSTHPEKEIFARIQNIEDANNDIFQFHYDWSTNNTSIDLTGESGATLDVSKYPFDHNDELQVSVYVTDGGLETSQVLSETTVIRKQGPKLSHFSYQVDESPYNPGESDPVETGSNLSITFNEHTSYSGQVIDSYQYTWSKNRDRLAETSDTLNLGSFQSGDIITADIIACDSQNFCSQSYSMPPFIVMDTGNAMPKAQSGVRISQSGSMMGLFQSGSFVQNKTDLFKDPDGDSLSGSRIVWYEDGTYKPALDNRLSLTGSDLSLYAQYKAELIPYDGNRYGITKYVNAVPYKLRMKQLSSSILAPESGSGNYTKANLPFLTMPTQYTKQISTSVSWKKQTQSGMQVIAGNNNQKRLAKPNLFAGSGYEVQMQTSFTQNTSTGIQISFSGSNTPPRLFSAKLSPNNAYGDSSFSFTGVEAHDVDTDTMTGISVWYKNGNKTYTGSTYSGSFAEGDTIKGEYTLMDGTDTSNSISLSRTIQNKPASFSGSLQEVIINPGKNGAILRDTSIDFDDISANDIDGDSVSYKKIWYKNFVPMSFEQNTTSDQIFLQSGSFVKGDILQYKIEALVDDQVNDAQWSESYLVENTAPVMQSLSYSQDTITFNTVLTGSAYATDLDGDELPGNYEYVWEYRKSSGATSIYDMQSGASVDLGQYDWFESGYELRAKAKANDGQSYSDMYTGQFVSIINAQPTPKYVMLDVSDTNFLISYDYYDFDGDRITDDDDSEDTNKRNIRCYSGSNLFYTGSDLAFDNPEFATGTRVKCEIEVSDGIDKSPTYTTNTIVSGTGTKYTLENFGLTKDNDTLSIYVNGAASGSTAHVEWYVNNQKSDYTGTSIDLSNGGFDRGDYIYAIYYYTVDGMRSVMYTSDYYRVGNSAPSMTSVGISPSSPNVGSTLEAVPEASDSDGDPLQYVYDWYVNGVPIHHNSAFLSNKYFELNDTVKVSVKPYDGLSFGAAKASWEKTIAEIPSSGGGSSQVSYSVPGPAQNISANAQEDESITINWEIPDTKDVQSIVLLRKENDAQGEGVTYVYLDKNARSYTDTDVKKGVLYTYTVRVLNPQQFHAMEETYISAGITWPTQISIYDHSHPKLRRIQKDELLKALQDKDYQKQNKDAFIRSFIETHYNNDTVQSIKKQSRKKERIRSELMSLQSSIERLLSEKLDDLQTNDHLAQIINDVVQEKSQAQNADNGETYAQWQTLQNAIEVRVQGNDANIEAALSDLPVSPWWKGNLVQSLSKKFGQDSAHKNLLITKDLLAAVRGYSLNGSIVNINRSAEKAKRYDMYTDSVLLSHIDRMRELHSTYVGLQANTHESKEQYINKLRREAQSAYKEKSVSSSMSDSRIGAMLNDLENGKDITNDLRRSLPQGSDLYKELESQNIAVTVKLIKNGEAKYTLSAKQNALGKIQVSGDIAPGRYDIRIRKDNTLQKQNQNVLVYEGTDPIYFVNDTRYKDSYGDMNGDGSVNTKDFDSIDNANYDGFDMIKEFYKNWN